MFIVVLKPYLLTYRVGTARGTSRTVDTDKCVEDTGLNWQYWNGDEWEFANDGLAVYCED